MRRQLVWLVQLVVITGSAGLCAATGEQFNCSDTTCTTVSCCDDPTGKNCPSTDCTPDQLQVVSPRQPCDCCKRCIGLQAEGDECDIYNTDNFGDLPLQICGNGLMCMPYEQTGFCRKIVDTACTIAQQQYDQDVKTQLIPGRLRPACDAEGVFGAVQRQPHLTTSCWSKDGRRIYGERATTQDDLIGCQCSRLHQAVADVDGLGPLPHCHTDGSFDQLQCSNATCFCVDSQNGTITSVVASWPFKDLLPCFNNTIYRMDYMKPCELAASELAQERQDWARQGFSLVSEEQPLCDIGGFFDKVQESRTDRFCVAPEGSSLDGYSVARSSPAAVNMTCNCARSSFHMASADQLTDLPQCCTNGDFRPWQCHGLYCYCVDSDGQQYGAAVPQSSLSLLACSSQACPSSTPTHSTDGRY